MMRSVSLLLLPALANGHGQLVVPATNRANATLEDGGRCSSVAQPASTACLWFTNTVKITGNITLPQKYRTVEINSTGTKADIFTTAPWRSPGTAIPLGHGCGLAGGGPIFYNNGGQPPNGIPQGYDMIKMPPIGTPPNWVKGSSVEVGFGISVNHGGGYSYRLCPTANVSDQGEECFQRIQLDFAGNSSWIRYRDASRYEFPRTTVTEGTYPAGSQWAMNPVPSCQVCEALSTCGEPLPPVTGPDETPWAKQVQCYAYCAGLVRTAEAPIGYDWPCAPGQTQFPNRVPGISGYGNLQWSWSIIDQVKIPTNIPSGDYMLSWRWDCEETNQIWQNCADVKIVDA